MLYFRGCDVMCNRMREGGRGCRSGKYVGGGRGGLCGSVGEQEGGG